MRGHPNERFLMHENEDGSILLQPAIALAAAQQDFQFTPELQELLIRAAASPTVRRVRQRRR